MSKTILFFLFFQRNSTLPTAIITLRYPAQKERPDCFRNRAL